MRLVAKKEVVADEEFSKEQLVVNYITSMLALEQAMEPYKEHKRELRSNYIKQGFLTKDEMRHATRAYRMLKKGDNLDDFVSFFNAITKNKSEV